MRTSDELAGFTEVLSAWAWWDAPREGVVRIDGRPHRFRCEFDDALDDYPSEYRVWPIGDAEFAADLALWAVWVDWRGRFDRDENPEPLVKDASWAAMLSRVRDEERAPAVVRVAIPEWRFDPDLSFALRAPRHLVRFAYVDEK